MEENNEGTPKREICFLSTKVQGPNKAFTKRGTKNVNQHSAKPKERKLNIPFWLGCARLGQ